VFPYGGIYDVFPYGGIYDVFPFGGINFGGSMEFIPP